MTDSTITGKQMKRLQTLWRLFCRQSNLDARDRGARLGWIGGAVGKQLSSFSDLTKAEAEKAIGAVQQHLPPELLRRARPSKRLAHAYGTAGRKGKSSREIRMIDAETWRLLDILLGHLGWTRERLDAFLRSNKSPVPGGILRTLDQANRVIWVLKNLLRRAETSTHQRSSPESKGAAPIEAPAPLTETGAP